MTPRLRVVSGGTGGNGPLAPPPDRGPLLTPEAVAALIGGVSPVWVRRNVPHKIPLGHCTVRWYEADVRAWVASLRASA